MLKNKTKNRIIVEKIKFCRNSLSKAKGLMFSNKITGTALIFPYKKEKRISLHMIFVFYPIDVIFLDKNRRIVELKESFRPFSFYISRKKAQYIIELPDGTTKRSHIEIGDLLEF